MAQAILVAESAEIVIESATVNWIVIVIVIDIVIVIEMALRYVERHEELEIDFGYVPVFNNESK